MNAAGSNANSPWPDGWYVFDEGRVQGPFTADAAFSMPEKSPAGSPKLVSRKGFTQWYPLRDLSELYRIADKLGQRTSTEVDKLESEVTENLANLEVLRALAQTGADPSVIAQTPRVLGKSIAGRMSDSSNSSFGSESLYNKIIDPIRVAPVDPAKINSPVSQSPEASLLEVSAPIVSVQPETHVNEAEISAKSTPVPPSARRAVSRKERKALARRMAQQNNQRAESPLSGNESGNTNLSAQKAAEPAQKSSPKNQRKLTAKQALLQEYLMLRGRLRLGELRSPLVTAFLLTPMTLFIYWGVWYRDLARELKWHTQNSADQKGNSASWLAWIPIVHIIMAYKLAALVREAEVQNGYRSISPILAGLFAVIPPLAMAYIQDGANQHWRLHVKHSIIERMNT